MPSEKTSTDAATKLTPDDVVVSQADDGVVIHIAAPTNMGAAQQHIFRAIHAGCAAANLLPARWIQSITPAGHIQAEVSGAYQAWSGDPRMYENRYVVARVVAAALEAFGYRVSTP